MHPRSLNGNTIKYKNFLRIFLNFQMWASRRLELVRLDSDARAFKGYSLLTMTCFLKMMRSSRNICLESKTFYASGEIPKIKC